MGKSAILTTWLARREAAGAAVPHHFIRRGAYDWDDPSQLVGSLVAQLEERFALQEPEADERLHPAARLHRMLSRVSSHQLAPRNERLVVVIDGLDEYDPPATTAGDPLAAFLPHALPAGVSVLCASRPRHPYVASLAARDGELVQIAQGLGAGEWARDRHPRRTHRRGEGVRGDAGQPARGLGVIQNAHRVVLSGPSRRKENAPSEQL